MVKRLRVVPIIFSVLAAFLFLGATPFARAESVEEKIKALEGELAALKAEQVEIRKEATAAGAVLPDISYRPGRGMRIRGADRSWAARILYEGQGQMGFFPGGPRSIDTDTRARGPSQGSMRIRHNEVGFNFQLDDGLFETGVTIKMDGSTVRTKSERLQVNFSKFSPYYPTVDWLHSSVRPYFDPVYNSSSSRGTTLERAIVNDALYSTASAEGVGLTWEDVPLGMGEVTFGAMYTTEFQLGDKRGRDSHNSRGVAGGINVSPFSKMKGSPLAGLSMGVGHIFDHTDNIRGDGAFYSIDVGSALNSVTIFEVETRGRRHNTAVWTQYEQGPVRFGASYNWHNAERDFTADGGGAKLGDAEMDVLLLRGGLFVWGPDGFLSGDENGGLMVAYNHFRNYFDAGSGYMTANSFDMRRHHIIQHIAMLRYFYKPNVILGLEYQANEISKLTGASGGDLRRLGIRETGGTYQTITLAFKINF